VGGVEGPLPGGLEPSVRDHSGRARVLMVIFETRHLTVSGGQFSWGGNLVTMGCYVSNYVKNTSYMLELQAIIFEK